MFKRLSWQDELAIIDQTMKAISGITDPQDLVEVYWKGIGELISVNDFVSLSRRNVDPPTYLVTRSSRFAEDLNPWTQRDLLPRMSGGLMGEFIYGNAPMILDDLPARLRDDDPGRFYLEGFQSMVGLPQYDGGKSLNGTIMLLKAGEELDRTMIPMMHWQAGLFGRGTTNLVLRNQLKAALVSLDRELQVVGTIQRSLLPSELPAIEGFQLAASYRTSARAGGDYYDFFPLDGGAWGIFIADVSGHGTPAAVLMAVTHAIAHAHPRKHTPPGALLNYLNHQLSRAYTRDGTFVTAFYAILDPTKRTLTYSRAGHNPPRLAHGDRVLSLDETGGLPLGILDEQSYCEASVALESGDLLLLYTDGITEAASPVTEASPQRQLFGTDRLDGLLLECAGSSAEKCLERIQAGLAEFCGNAPQADDQTLIAIRCR
jgi:sigma-B regulation protein RsbU (phosphoserine phosphatase)